MNNILSSLYYDRYINPVYSPIQVNSYFSENCTGPNRIYSITLSFDIDGLAGSGGTPTTNYFILNNVRFQMSVTPTQNEIPDPSLYIGDYEQFTFFVRQAIQNNPIFDNYVITTLFDNNFLFLTLTHRIPYTLDRIVWSTDAPALINLDDETFPDYCYSAQTLSNYSLWMDIFVRNKKNLFNWIDLTGGTGNILESTVYKTFQPNNKYIFNISPILQSVSRTTEPNLSFGSDYFQQDTSSLNNLRLEFSESYDVEFGGITSVRKFPILVNGQSAIENKWFWDAARNLSILETYPYYILDTQYIALSGVEINGRTQLLFNYQLDINETISLEDASQTVVFTASTFNDGDKIFRIEQSLTGTVENFITVLLNYFTQYNVSYTGYGYSQVYLDIVNSFFDPALDLITTGSSNGHIVRSDFIPSSTENQILIDYPEEEGVNQLTEIIFLTDRPRKDTSLKYNLAQFNTTGFTYKHNTLSLFITPYEDIDNISSSTGYEITQQLFNVRIKYFENGQWSDTWVESNPEPWLWNSGTDQGTDNGLYHVNLDPLTWSASTSTEKIRYAIGWYIKTTDDTFYIRNYSEEFEYDIDLVCDYQIVKSFMFLNDLGGWDYYDFIEDLTTQYNRTETLISTDASGLIEQNTTYEQMFQNSIEQSFKVRTIVNSQAEYDWLYQLVKSSRVYYIDTNNTSSIFDDYYQQVIITNTDFQQTENTNQWVLNIEYRIAIKDISQKSI